MNYTIDEVLDKPSDWIALVYKEILAEETKKYKILASFFGVNIDSAKKEKPIYNSMSNKDFKNLGFGYKRIK